MDFARPDIEVDMVVGGERSESLHDAAQGYERRPARREFEFASRSGVMMRSAPCPAPDQGPARHIGKRDTTPATLMPQLRKHAN